MTRTAADRATGPVAGKRQRIPVLLYQIQSYQHWQQYFGREDLSHGTFGKNLIVDGLLGDEVGIGDRHRIGTARRSQARR